MLRLTTLIPIAVAAIICVGALWAAIAIPFRVSERVAQSYAERQSALEPCWGCTAFEQLGNLFEFQVTQARPLVRRMKVRLLSSNAPPDLREPLEQELALATAQLRSAELAREYLSQRMSDCAARDACRAAPSAFIERNCGGTWPNDQVQEQYIDLAEALFVQASRCRAFSCPDLNCTAHARISGTLVTMMDLLADLTPEDDPNPDQLLEAAREVDLLREHLERLPFTLTEQSAIAPADWSTQLGQLVREQAVEASALNLPDTSWRWRFVQRGLRRLVALSSVAEASSLGWTEMTAIAADVLAQLQVIGWFIAEQGSANGLCRTVDQNRVFDIASALRRASAALSVCGARGGCSGPPTAPNFAPGEARPAGGIIGTDVLLQEGYRALRGELGILGVAAGEPVNLIADRLDYFPGEAVRISYAGTNNRCMAEEGARLGLFKGWDQDERVGEDALVIRSEEGMALFVAPDLFGRYTVRAFAPEARGGSELGHVELLVSNGGAACEGFSGTWDTNFGVLRMYARDDRISGSYRRNDAGRPGFLTGELSGHVLYGTWESEIGTGGARLVLSADGNSFRGTWSNVPGQFAGIGNWTGTCVAP